MKNKLLLVIILILALFMLKPSSVRASHAAGGEIIYEWISDSTYRVFLKFYRDCTGIAEPDSVQLCLSNTCTSFTATVWMTKWNGPLPDGNNGDPVSAGCSAYKNKCDSPASKLPGYREWWYAKLVTLPFKCNYWKYSVSINARNPSQNIPQVNLYIETTFNNLLFQGNSSPYFSIKPIPYVCNKQPFSYNNGAIDPNGDSLSTDIINPLDGAVCGPGSPITLATSTPPLTIPTNPFQTNNTFSINPNTGQMNFTANVIVAPTVPSGQTLTTRVREYYGGPGPNHGVLIGYIMRDIQVQVLDCSTTAPVPTPPLNIVGGAINTTGNGVNGCVGQLLEFEWDMKSTDPLAVLLATDNHRFSIPSANVTYTNEKTDSVRGKFSWTPTPVDAGLHNLIVTIKDSTCLPPGIMMYYPFSIPIFIYAPVKAVPDTSICPGETAYLDATGGGNYQWSVLPGGAPITSLSCVNCQSPIATPLVPTTYVVVSTVNTFCANNKDTVNIGVLPGLNFTKLPDTITCPQNSVVLDLKTLPPAGVTYKAKWTPATFLNNDTLSAPTTTPNSPVTYRVLLTSSANKCKGYDTVFVDVLSGYKLHNIDTAICNGQTVQVNATGDTRYNFSWSHTNSSVNPFSNPGIINPVITPAPAVAQIVPDTSTFRITARYGACRDSSQEFKIEVQPYPTVIVDDDASRCEGDTMQIHSTITPAYYPFTLNWTPGASLSNSTIANPIFKASQTTLLKLTAKTTANCASSDSMLMTVFPARFLFTEGDTAVCPGAVTQIGLTGNGIKTFRWHPDLNISDKNGYTPFVWPTASTTYTVYGIDTNSCKDTAEVRIIVHPKATISLPDSVRIYPGEAYQLDPQGNCGYYSWFPPVGLTKSDRANPIAKPEVNTRYIVTGKTESGCTTTDSITILVAPESIVDVPNAFTPGSVPNSTFKIVRRGDIVLKNFSIYNRWGLRIFETSDVNKGWDGTYNGQAQPSGVYVYTVEGVTATGKKFSKQGNITLLR